MAITSEQRTRSAPILRCQFPTLALAIGFSLGSAFGAPSNQDNWTCVEESSMRESDDTYLICGVGTGATESEARFSATSAAINEFEQLCSQSSTCRGFETEMTPLRNTCREEKGRGIKCFRGLRYFVTK